MEWSYCEFKISLIHIIGSDVEIDNVKKQMGNISKYSKIIWNNHKKMLENWNSVTEIKNVFDGLISILDISEDRNCEIKDISMETSQTEMSRVKEMLKRNGICKNWGTVAKDTKYV